MSTLTESENKASSEHESAYFLKMVILSKHIWSSLIWEILPSNHVLLREKNGKFSCFGKVSNMSGESAV